MRGKQSEDNVRLVLKILKDQGVICSYRKTNQGGSEDLCGIDFYISLKLKGVRVDVPLQVKSSQFGVNKHYANPRSESAPIEAINGQSQELRKEIIAVVMKYKKLLGDTDSPKPKVEERPPHRVKLDQYKADKIRELYSHGVCKRELSEIYGVTESCIKNVIYNVSWVARV